MKKHLQQWTWPLVWAAGMTTSAAPAYGQIVPVQNGVGTAVTQDGNQFDIHGGTQAGGNLFHEFETLSVNQGQTANFVSNSSVFNIVGRVSGGSASHIDGTVQVQGSDANLYLVNPAGVLFGPNARLSLSGSFTATSADQIGFGEAWLSAANSESVDYSKLTAEPSALRFEAGEVGAVVNQGDLSVGEGESLTLVGGAVVNAGRLSAPGGEVALVAVGTQLASERTVQLSAPGRLLSMEVDSADWRSAVDGDGALAPTALPEMLTGGVALDADSLIVNDDGSIVLARMPEGVTVSGEVSVRSSVAAGGQVLLLGDRVNITGAEIDASGDRGGTVRIGGDYQGQGTLPRASQTLFDSNSVIRADGLNGAGGSVVLWADERAVAQGTISAVGTTQGGFVETSAPYLDTQGIRVNAGGQAGNGTWLVDPVDVQIVSGLAGVNQISASAIESALDSGTNFAVTTAADTGGNGDISLLTSINQTGASTANLTFTGRRFAHNNNSINLASTGQLTFEINAVNPELVTDSSSIESAIAAIGTVNGRSLLRLGAGTYNFANVVALDKNVEIEGSGAENTILAAQSSERLFDVHSGSVVSLRNVTATTAGLGAFQSGGGISNRGALTVSNSRFIDNRASVNGGALDSYSGGLLSVSDSEFVNNRSLQGGGAVNIAGSPGSSIQNSLFDNNFAADDGGAIRIENSVVTVSNSRFQNNASGDDGGAAAITGSGRTVFDAVVFQDNTANSSGGALTGWNGADIAVNNTTFIGNSASAEGGALFLTSGTYEIDNSSILNNGAINNNLNILSGGGLYSYDSQITLRNSVISGNQAQGSGGGLYLDSSTLNTSMADFYNNSAGGDGGAIHLMGAAKLDVSGALFADNLAQARGGALSFNSSQSVVVADSSFVNNQSVSDGGAVANNSPSGTLTILNSNFDGNRTQSNGGAIFARANSQTVIENAQYFNNQAVGNGGALYSAGSLSLSNGLVRANHAQGNGGGLAIAGNNGSLTLTDTAVENNTTDGNGAGLFLEDRAIAQIVGTLVTDTDGMSLSASTRFEGNAATRDGGGIGAAGNSRLQVSGVLFRGNRAADDGGGIAVVQSGEAVVENSNFENNRAVDNGGGLYRNNILLSTPDDYIAIAVNNSRFIANEATNGGALFLGASAGSAALQGVLLRDNSAIAAGGGVSSAGQITLQDSEVVGNIATNGGGAQINDGAHLTATSTTFAANQAVFGGAIANYGSSELTNTTLSGNIATQFGGAIHTTGNSVLVSSTVANNTASSLGGGIAAVNARSSRLLNTIVAQNSSPTAADVSGYFDDLGHNLIGQSTGSTGFVNSVLVGSALAPLDPLLAPLADNGGPTRTHLLQSNSPAVNAGSSQLVLDQRGFFRPVGSAADIGAVELSASELMAETLPLLSHLSSPPVTGRGSNGENLLVQSSVAKVDSADNIAIRRLEQTFSQSFEDYWDLSLGPDLSFDQVQAILRRAQEEYKTNSAVIYAVFTAKEKSAENTTGNVTENATNGILRVEPAPAADDQLTLALVLPAGELVRYRLPVTRQMVERQVRLLRTTVSDPDDEFGYHSLTQQLYQWLLAPLENDLAAQGIQNLMYALDAGLRTAPIAAMQDANDFVLERFGISVVPSMGLMQADFPVPVRRSTVAMGVDQFTDEMPLPAVPFELAMVKKLIPAAQVIFNEGSTLTALEAVQVFAKPGVLHLATHATFDAQTPEDSYIHLWNDVLSMAQFSRLDWRTSDLDLLILSACSTALSSLNAELGFAGLAAAAGVDATVGSLWQVSDIGTLALMSEFYTQLERTELRFEALRQAQLALLRGTTRIENGSLVTSIGQIALPAEWNLPDEATTLVHPFFWSAFTMVGNPW